MILRRLLLLAAAGSALACGGDAPAVDPAAGNPAAEAGGWDDAATRVLSGAARALGGIDRLMGVGGIYADAEVTGPRSSFRTLMISDRQGRARMEQTTGFLGGIGLADTWVWNAEAGRSDTLDAIGIVYVRGHELHARVLMPETRFSFGRFEGVTTVDGEPALTVRGRTRAGAETLLFYRASDTLPVGQRELTPDPDVEVRYGDWETLNGIRVFRSATFTQADEVFTYRFAALSLQAQPDSMFDVRAPRR